MLFPASASWPEGTLAVVIIVVDSAYFHTLEFRLDGHVLRGFREFNRVMQAPDLWPRLQHTVRRATPPVLSATRRRAVTCMPPSA
ncbi:hypothetical protein PAPYR_13503 [Paratrimastix pyriformis]|uniref:Uncharacterized protein n=1 Tax=Paratrimastix pyriformis TaxID=342808 RepID=A0ABQ8U080_9EUKA|nr:hypothetical protein PAPYR_13503 [Paratrimastix pyriformis]